MLPGSQSQKVERLSLVQHLEKIPCLLHQPKHEYCNTVTVVTVTIY